MKIKFNSDADLPVKIMKIKFNSDADLPVKNARTL